MDFYKSRKFWYNAIMLLAALFIAIVPTLAGLDAEETKTLREMVPWVLGMGFALSAKHTIMDAMSIAKGFQVPTVEDAVENVVEIAGAPHE